MTDIRGDIVLLRPLEPSDWAALRAIREAPDVDRWWGPLEDDFPGGDYPEATRLVVVVDGRVAGMVQFEEEDDPDYRHADIDVFLAPEYHGRGLGTDAMRATARHLIEDRGHHRLTLSTVPENVRAIACYEKVGFRRVGITHASQRDVRTGEWVDELLMELVTTTRHAPPTP